jgi:hypothetical protein
MSGEPSAFYVAGNIDLNALGDTALPAFVKSSLVIGFQLESSNGGILSAAGGVYTAANAGGTLVATFAQGVFALQAAVVVPANTGLYLNMSAVEGRTLSLVQVIISVGETTQWVALTAPPGADTVAGGVVSYSSFLDLATGARVVIVPVDVAAPLLRTGGFSVRAAP